MRVALFIFFVLGLSAGVFAQSSVKVVHEYYAHVFEQYNASVVKVLQLKPDSVSEGEATHKYFSFKKGNRKVSVAYQLYEDGRIISVQVSGQRRDLEKLYRTFYEKNLKKRSVIKNDEWVRMKEGEGKIIVQAIIY
ncbi:hypothetical protein [Chitinophaga sancti]|uniref:Uncharacterized protein n=1 Tax=Chitinophaga sancti TaxID=1004 RepID=A0A1K1MTL6_9BACT|nr:hypothetical protein [Chitinophaga sancti]WQD62977.1 hypothetical protein U0033_01120 [Chitinophaga sancti]WQG91398.1 hypothetical protein SR876_07795 [Chitinophaga sancti]SFW26512.1 hypothetical protein SAMN05661012_00878 [Chitinophaga sancti]